MTDDDSKERSNVETNDDSSEKSDDVAAAVDGNVITSESKTENLADVSDAAATPVRVSTGNRKRKSDSTGSEREGFRNLRSGKKALKRAKTDNPEEQGNEANDDDSAEKNDDVAVAVDGNVMTPESRTECSGVNVNLIADNAPARVRERSGNSSSRERGSGSSRNGYMERFHDIARENASRFAFFAPEEED
ncbi:hypothetical protein E2542_SST01609 [Spatholobus suberectus]|nr:hypothetical protein E2542_SST01609 [Spatholobus suberectus]